MEFDFQQILAASPNPYVIVDHDLVIVWMNEAYLQVTMRTREALVGRAMFDAFPAEPGSDSRELLERSFRRVIDTGHSDELALIRYDIERPEGGFDVRYWSATHTPIVDTSGTKSFILQHTVDVTELQELRQLRDEMGVIRRANAVQQENLSLVDESRRLMDFFEQAPSFIAVLSGREHRFQMANRAYRELVGRRDVVGKRVTEALPEVIDQGFIDVLDRVFDTGEAYFGHREGVELITDETGHAQQRFLNFIFQPVIDGTGETSGIIVQGYDVTDEVRAQERQALLVNELNHRVKNTLALVQGLAQQSFTPDGDVKAGRAVFDARLRALASAHNLLTQESWSAASITQIVIQSVEAAVGPAVGRITLHGPDFRLPPQFALALAMIVHELCTNATKYGALANDAGTVAVTWNFSDTDGRTFVLEWKETGGPPVELPSARGFGTRLIARGISGAGVEDVALSFEPDGLRYTLQAELPQS